MSASRNRMWSAPNSRCSAPRMKNSPIRAPQSWDVVIVGPASVSRLADPGAGQQIIGDHRGGLAAGIRTGEQLRRDPVCRTLLRSGGATVRLEHEVRVRDAVDVCDRIRFDDLVGAGRGIRFRARRDRESRQHVLSHRLRVLLEHARGQLRRILPGCLDIVVRVLLERRIVHGAGAVGREQHVLDVEFGANEPRLRFGELRVHRRRVGVGGGGGGEEEHGDRGDQEAQPAARPRPLRGRGAPGRRRWAGQYAPRSFHGDFLPVPG